MIGSDQIIIRICLNEILKGRRLGDIKVYEGDRGGVDLSSFEPQPVMVPYQQNGHRMSGFVVLSP